MTDPQQYVLHINALGELVFVYDDELADMLGLGDAIVARASHVEPCQSLAGVAWTADLEPIDGPMLGPFPTRGAALDAERKWLEENLV